MEIRLLVVRIENRATIQAIHRLDAGRILDLVQQRVGMEHMYRHASKARMAPFLVHQRLLGRDTERGAAGMSAGWVHSIVEAYCIGAEALGLALNPLQERNWLAVDVVSMPNQEYRQDTMAIGFHTAVVARVARTLACWQTKRTARHGG